MSNWNKITLFKFQQISEINGRENLSDIDKALFATCVVFDMTEYQLDNTHPKKAQKLLAKVTKIFSEELKPEPKETIGEYVINYVPARLTFGQFITLAFYVSRNAIQYAHQIFATLADPDDKFQQERADFFLKQPVASIMGSLKLFMERFRSFNKEYELLFGVGTEEGKKIELDPFQKQYGWIYSATRVADHNRITLDEAFALPVRVAFNDLAYLKAKDKFDEQQFKNK